MLIIYLVPSGETDLSANGELLGINNPTLNANGLSYAERIAKSFESTILEAVFSGPLKREVVTARRIAKPHEIPVRIENKLRDVNYGIWSGSTWERIERDEPNRMRKLRRSPYRYKFPGGEKLKKVWKRVALFAKYLHLNYGTGYLVIVAEDFISAMIVSQFTGIAIADLEPWAPSRGQLTVLEQDEKECTIRLLRGKKPHTEFSSDG